MSVSSNVPGNQSDGLHQLIKKMAQLAPQNKGCQKLSESSAKHQNQEKADLRRLEDLVILLYEGYTPYSGHIPECKCKGVDSGNCVLQVMKAFLTVGGRNVIVEILRNGGNSVVEWAMKIAWRIYNSRNLLLKCKGEFDESAAKLPLSSTIGNLSATSKKIQFKINPREYEFESLVISTLQSRKILPVRAVVVLFEIIVGDLRMPGKLRTDVYMVPISEFQLIPIILTKFDNFSVSGLKSALESLNVLLLNTKINLEIMYRQQSWQKWLVPFLLSNSSKQMSGKITSEQISPEDELEIFKFTANLFTMIHYHCFKTKKLGFKQLFKDTKSALVQRFGWNEETSASIRVMLFSLIKRLQNDVLAFQTDYSIPVWDNIFELFEIIENYIFYEPTEPSQSSKNKKKMTSKSERNKKIGIHLYDDGSCQDIILVDEIMDLFDHKIDIPTPIGSEKKNTTSSKMTESILKGLIQERDFYKNVKSFMVGLENAKISDKDNLVKKLSQLLLRRRNEGVISRLIGNSKIEKQLAVVVQNQKVLVSSTTRNKVDITKASEEAFVNGAKRGFKSFSAAQNFCLEKKNAALISQIEKPVLKFPSNKKKPKFHKKVSSSKESALKLPGNETPSSEKKKTRKKMSGIKRIDPNQASVMDLYGDVDDMDPEEESNTQDQSIEKDDEQFNETIEVPPLSRKNDVNSSGSLKLYDEDRSQSKSFVEYPEEVNTVNVTTPELEFSSEIPIPEDEFASENMPPNVSDHAAGHDPNEEYDYLDESGKLDEIDESYQPKWAVALYSFQAEAENEINLAEGDLIEVLQEKPNGWWLVTVNEALGYAPMNYLKVVDDKEALDILTRAENRIEDEKLDPPQDEMIQEDLNFEEEIFAVNEFIDSAIKDDVVADSLNSTMLTSTTNSAQLDSDNKEQFKCGYCGVILSHREFYEHNGIICCKDDLIKQFYKCTLCSLPIDGDHLNIANGKVHVRCACCSVCQEPLISNDDLFERDGKLFCGSHYDNQFGISCAHCNDMIDGQYITALGKNWHVDHFICAGPCRRPITEDFLVSDDQPYCREDYETLIAKKCSFCHKAVISTALGLDDEIFHVSCVKCSACGCEYSSGETFLLDDDNSVDDTSIPPKFLCSDDYRKKYVKKCSRCSLLIDINEEKARAGDSYFHIKCLECNQCGQSLINQQSFIFEDKIFCQKDYESLFLAKCSLCNEPIQGKVLSLLNMKCHPKCIKCSECMQELYESNLGIHQDSQGRLLCRNHYLKTVAKQCSGCKEFIVKGSMMTIKGLHFHADCLKCSICASSLKNQPFGFKDSSLRCAAHANN